MGNSTGEGTSSREMRWLLGALLGTVAWRAASGMPMPGHIDVSALEADVAMLSAPRPRPTKAMASSRTAMEEEILCQNPIEHEREMSLVDDRYGGNICASAISRRYFRNGVGDDRCESMFYIEPETGRPRACRDGTKWDRRPLSRAVKSADRSENVRRSHLCQTGGPYCSKDVANVAQRRLVAYQNSPGQRLVEMKITQKRGNATATDLKSLDQVMSFASKKRWTRGADLEPLPEEFGVVNGQQLSWNDVMKKGVEVRVKLMKVKSVDLSKKQIKLTKLRWRNKLVLSKVFKPRHSSYGEEWRDVYDRLQADCGLTGEFDLNLFLPGGANPGAFFWWFQ